ncbi:MAG: peptide deformylase [Gammaproteobacteria bacterium]|nr:MAG: peptide deformylase [Gammaproteobacteria bacterium]
MAVLEVLHYPDLGLRKKAVPIETVDESCLILAKDMLQTMYEYNGIGLASTQVNVHKRLVVIDLSEDKNEAIYLINPEILSSEGTKESQEGCLSLPEYYDTVIRAERITYRFQDLEGKVIKSEADGLLSVCIQHEIDHLDGKLFIDYLSPMKRRRLRKKLEKQEKQEKQEKHQAKIL